MYLQSYHTLWFITIVYMWIDFNTVNKYYNIYVSIVSYERQSSTYLLDVKESLCLMFHSLFPGMLIASRDGLVQYSLHLEGVGYGSETTAGAYTTAS